MKYLNYGLLLGFLLSINVVFAQNDTTTIDNDTIAPIDTIVPIVEEEVEEIETISEQFYVNVLNKDGAESLEIYTTCSLEIIL